MPELFILYNLEVRACLPFQPWKMTLDLPSIYIYIYPPKIYAIYLSQQKDKAVYFQYKSKKQNYNSVSEYNKIKELRIWNVLGA